MGMFQLLLDFGPFITNIGQVLVQLCPFFGDHFFQFNVSCVLRCFRASRALSFIRPDELSSSVFSFRNRFISIRSCVFFSLIRRELWRSVVNSRSTRFCSSSLGPLSEHFVVDVAFLPLLLLELLSNVAGTASYLRLLIADRLMILLCFVSNDAMFNVLTMLC